MSDNNKVVHILAAASRGRSNPQKPTYGGSGGNGGTIEPMDSRVAKLEASIAHIEREVSQVKWWILAQIAAGIVTVIGTGIAIQQMTVGTFEAASKYAPVAAPATNQQPIIINVPPAAPAPAAERAAPPAAAPAAKPQKNE